MSLAKKARDDQAVFPGADFVLASASVEHASKRPLRVFFVPWTLCPIIEKNGHRFYGGKLPILEISCSLWTAVCLNTRHIARLSELCAVDVYAIGIYFIINVKAADRCRTA